MTTLTEDFKELVNRLHSLSGEDVTPQDRELLGAVERQLVRADSAMAFTDRVLEETREVPATLVVNGVRSVLAGVTVIEALKTWRSKRAERIEKDKLNKALAQVTPKITVQGRGDGSTLKPGKYRARKDPNGKENEYIVDVPRDSEKDFPPFDLGFIGTIHALDDDFVTYGLGAHGDIRLTREKFVDLDNAGKVTIEVKVVER